MFKWVNSILKRYSRKLPADKKGLLLLSNHESHKGIELEKALKELRFDIVYLPNCTSKLQPLDLVVNKPLKDLYDERFEGYMASLIEKIPKKKSEAFIPPSKEKVITWISLCWKQLSLETTKKGWGCLCSRN